MDLKQRVSLSGSAVQPMASAAVVSAVPDHQEVTVSIFLKPRVHPNVAALASGLAPRVTRANFAQSFGADPTDIANVVDFARAYGLNVVETDPAKRRIVVSGPASAISQAFGVRLDNALVPRTGRMFRAASGPVSVPSAIAPAIEAVLGLDTRPVVQPRLVVNRAEIASGVGPAEVAALYNFPQDVNGAGQTIALVEFGGGFNIQDLAAYFSAIGRQLPSVLAVSVDGASNQPGSAADLEVMLDIEVAGAIANGARIAVYFAPNTDQGFADALLNAIHDSKLTPSVLSISWGAAEDSWSPQARAAVAAALQDAATLGVTVAVASGDSGSSDGQADNQLHVDFPASSPFALACGGTTMTPNGSTIGSEVAWNNSHGATGGGVSAFFEKPSYQQALSIPAHPQTGFGGRGVPDVSGHADPANGYRITLNGGNTTVGGTSAVAPMWAALVALLNEKLGRRLGFINSALYKAGSSVFRDITTGSNDSSRLGAYSAGPGWDACTGLGSPNVSALYQALFSEGGPTGGGQGSGPPPPPPPPSNGDIPFPWNF